MMKKVICIFAILQIAASCGLDESTVFDTPFINVTTSDGSYQTIVGSDVNNINTYYINLSSHEMTEEVTVNYKITVGAGLEEGIDYSIVTSGNSVIFKPGVYKMPIRIRWMPHALADEDADNTMTIELESNDRGFTLGLPGPSGLSKSLTITKKNL